MSTIDVNNVKLSYEEKGKGDKTVIALPGYGGSARTTLLALDKWTEFFRVIALDVRGHGNAADVIEDWSLAQMADDTYQIAKKLGLSKFIVQGVSMGGAIALRLTLDHPEIVEKLILVSSMPASGATTPKELLEQALKMELTRDIALMMTKSLLIKPSTKEIDAMVEGFVDDTLLVKTVVREKWLLEEEYFNWEPQLKDVKTPTLVIYGDSDTVCDPVAQHRMAQLIPNAKEVIVPGTGHLMTFEEPEMFLQAVKEFINS